MASNTLVRFALAVGISLLGACDDDDTVLDPDGGVVPDGTPMDGEPDGDDDAGTSDAGTDAGANDAGADASVEDAGSDAGADAGTEDAAVDAGELDAGEDGGLSDAGTDAGSCEPVTETCNAIDDDCDGLVDEGLATLSAVSNRRTLLPTGTTLSPAQRGFSQLLTLAGGPVQLTSVLGVSDQPGPIDVTRLDDAGAVVGVPETILPTARVFLAASLDDTLAVLWRNTDDDGDATVDDLADTRTFVSLFDASDSPVVELDTLELAGPADISEIELQRTAGGELRVFVAYAPWALNGGAATLTPTVIQTLRYDTTGTPALLSMNSFQLASDARPTTHFVKKPCGEGWLVAFWQRPTDQAVDRVISIRAMSLDGVLDTTGAAAFSLTGQGIQGFAAAERCDDDASKLVLFGDDPLAGHDETVAHLDAHELSYTNDTGLITHTGTLSVVQNTAFVRAIDFADQWIVTLRNFGDGPTGIYRLDVAAGEKDIITPMVQQGGLSSAGLITADVNLYFLPNHGLMTAGDGILATFGNARPADSPIGEDAVAVTHRIEPVCM